jgi:hypothetical protein
MTTSHSLPFIHLLPSHPGRAWVRWAVLCSLVGLAACSGRPDTTQPGHYLEKLSGTQVQLVITGRSGQRQVWVGGFKDDSPKSTFFTPLPAGQDNGLFRWSHPGCAELSFVLTREELKCTTCMEPVTFVPFTASCPLDQRSLPVQGWTEVGLERPK